MIKSKFIVREFSKNQNIELDNVLSLDVYNNGACIAFVNKLKIEPDTKVTLVVADNTMSDITINLSFAEENSKPPRLSSSIANVISENPSPVPGIVPAKIKPDSKQTVVLYYKTI